MNFKFCISGGTGFIGKILRKGLAKSNADVLVITRNQKYFYPLSNREYCVLWDGKFLDNSFLEDVDVFINLSGETIAGRMGEKKKELIYKSRIESTKAIVNSIKNSKTYPKYFFQASAIGIYKELEEPIYENSPYDNDFLGSLVQEWEREARELEKLDINLYILRFGVVLGKNGGIFKMLNPFFKRGLGVILGKGDYHISWIYEGDLARAFKFLLQKGKGGVYNFTSPKPIKGKDFFKTWGRVYKKPVFIYFPFFLLQIFLGKEAKRIMGKNLKVIPKALLEENFNFSEENLKDVFLKLSKYET